jgi:hypothetical protein
MTGVLALEAKLVLQIFFTLAVLSFLYRDNPIYRFAEHAFVGVAAGYFVVVEFHTVFLPNLVRPLSRQGIGGLLAGRVHPVELLLVIPAVLGLLVFCKFLPRGSWLGRWPMAVVIGVYSGQAILGSVQGDLVPQIQANLLPILKEGSWSRFALAPGLFTFLDLLYNPVLIVGVACSLVYFFFSSEHKGVTGRAAGIGIAFLMISFGASYGNTVMTRVSLFLERAYFLLRERTPLPDGRELVNVRITLVVMALLVGIIAASKFQARRGRS